MGESKEAINGKLELCRQASESHGFCLNISMTEYIDHKFSSKCTNSNLEVKIGHIPLVTWFKYFESIIQNDGEIEGDINHRIC